MQSRMDDVLMMLGIPCSTFVTVSRGSTQRCEFMGMGSVTSLTVYRANKVASRPVRA